MRIPLEIRVELGEITEICHRIILPFLCDATQHYGTYYILRIDFTEKHTNTHTKTLLAEHFWHS